MTITLYTSPISTEVRQKSHLEVQDIKDAAARDNARAGLDKVDEINRCLLDGFAQLQRLCLRFLAEHVTLETDDAGSLPESFSYDFVMAERRAVNKAEPLTSAMHNFVVQHALWAFYNTVNQVDLANRHAAAARLYSDQIEDMIYYKQPPRV